MLKKEDYVIVVDSREQKPLWTNNTVVKKLDAGDYSILGHEDRISCERKSMADLFSTLSQGHARFKRELQRAQSLDYFAIVVDGSLTSCINKDFPGANYSQMKGHVIASILFTLHIKYGINFFFSQNRAESKTLIRGLFKAYLKNSI